MASDEQIQRVLHISPRVHVYQIPPQSSNKGHTASQWTSPPSRQIFTARLRVTEMSSTADDTKINASIVLEDPSSGELFAAAPYTSPGTVEQTLDSSRFFAIRVVGDGGMKAVLGIGFEDRSEAFDFGVALQEVRKVLGWEDTPGQGKKSTQTTSAPEVKRDWSLKEGEMLKVDIGGLGKKREEASESSVTNLNQSGGFSLLPPPPSAREVRGERRRSREVTQGISDDTQSVEGKRLEELGFDDGEFGEFQ